MVRLELTGNGIDIHIPYLPIHDTIPVGMQRQFRTQFERVATAITLFLCRCNPAPRVQWLMDVANQMQDPRQEDRSLVRRLVAYDKFFKFLQSLQGIDFRDWNRKVVGRIGCVAGNAGPKKVDKVLISPMVLGTWARVVLIIWANNVGPRRGHGEEFPLSILERAGSVF